MSYATGYWRETLITRQCVCGKSIRSRDPLCKDCREAYGRNPRKWPDWVNLLVHDEQREVDRARRHNHDLELFDEYCAPISSEAAANLSEARAYPEMDFDEFTRFVHEWSDGDSSDGEPTEGDDDGYGFLWNEPLDGVRVPGTNLVKTTIYNPNGSIKQTLYRVAQG